MEAKIEALLAQAEKDQQEIERSQAERANIEQAREGLQETGRIPKQPNGHT